MTNPAEGRRNVGWVERSETHRPSRGNGLAMGFAALYPSYEFFPARSPGPMNYRHAFHAGNHADILKHVVMLALCDALVAKPTPCFALDTHAGRGLYRL